MTTTDTDTPTELLTVVTLTDDELRALSGRCRPETQTKVTAALMRIAARTDYPDLPPALAGLIADVFGEARDTGQLIYQRRPITRCRLCRAESTYAPFKSGPRRGQPNYSKPRPVQGVELAHRFVSVNMHVTLGGCLTCVERCVPAICAALVGVPVAVPDKLRALGQPRRVRHDNRHCKKCGWTGHEGQMRYERTLMGDGTFPSKCPDCGAGGALSRDVERVPGWVVVPVDEPAT